MKKILKQIFILSIISLIFLIPLTYAATGYLTCATGETCVRIDHGGGSEGKINMALGPLCYTITNNHVSNDYFIPTRSTDFSSFLTDHPAEISVTACGTAGGWGPISTGTCQLTGPNMDIYRQLLFKYCVNPYPDYGGTNCVKDSGWLIGATTVTVSFENQIYTNVRYESKWESCVPECANKLQGASCNDRVISTQSQGPSVLGPGVCDEQGACVAPPRNGGWSSNFYGECSATCEGGHRTVTRYCINPTPANGGAACVVDTYKNEFCSKWGSNWWDSAWCFSYAFENLAWDQTGTTSTAIGLIPAGTQYETLSQSVADDYDGLNICNTQPCGEPPTDTATPPLTAWAYYFENGELMVIHSNGDLVNVNNMYGTVDTWNIDFSNVEAGDLTITYKDGTSTVIPQITPGVQADYTQGGISTEPYIEPYVTGTYSDGIGVGATHYYFWSDGTVTKYEGLNQITVTTSTIPVGEISTATFSDGVTRHTFWSGGSVTIDLVDDNIYATTPITPVNKVATGDYMT
jgi:hypothetical protein